MGRTFGNAWKTCPSTKQGRCTSSNHILWHLPWSFKVFHRWRFRPRLFMDLLIIQVMNILKNYISIYIIFLSGGTNLPESSYSIFFSQYCLHLIYIPTHTSLNTLFHTSSMSPKDLLRVLRFNHWNSIYICIICSSIFVNFSSVHYCHCIKIMLRETDLFVDFLKAIWNMKYSFYSTYLSKNNL